MARDFLFCIVLFAISVSLKAQNTLKGCIKDRQNSPIEFVVVSIADIQKPKSLQHTITDTQGNFSFASLKNGKYDLNVSFLGYKSVKTEVELNGDKELDTIVLEEDAQMLEGTKVIARKVQNLLKIEGGKMNVMVNGTFASQLESSLDVLKHTPGVSVDSKGNVSLSSLGATAVYVNGAKVHLKGEALGAYLRTLSPAMIEKIEIMPNADARYESDGAGGIINIILKKNNLQGFAFQTGQGLSIWESIHSVSDFMFVYNKKNWRTNWGYNHNIGDNPAQYGNVRYHKGNKTETKTRDWDNRNTYATNFDIEYLQGDKHSFILSGFCNVIGGPGYTSTFTKIYTGENVLKESLNAECDYYKQWDIRYGGSFAWKWKISEAHKLKFIIDGIGFSGVYRSRQPIKVFVPSGTLIRKNLFQNNTDRGIGIVAFSADYEANLAENQNLSVGTKVSFVRSDNDISFFADGHLKEDRSKKFVYDEYNTDGYVQYSGTFDKFSISGGIRMEFMNSTGSLYALGKSELVDRNKTDKLRLFPNLSLSYNVSDKFKLSCVYSRRQDKPHYEALNPIEFLLDEYTYWKGNPFLRPQVNDKVALNFSSGKINLSLYYNYLNDYYTYLTDPYGPGVVVMTTKNIGKQHLLGGELSAAFKFFRWWRFQAFIGGYYKVNKLKYEKYLETYNGISGVLSLNNTFSLPWDLKLDVNGKIMSRELTSGYMYAHPSGSIDISLNRYFGEHLSLSVYMTDILHTQRWNGDGRKGDFSLEQWGYGQSRMVGIKLNFNIGNQTNEHKNRELSEKERL